MTSVYALDADLKLSQDQPQKDGQEPGHPVAPQVSHEQPPVAISSGTSSATATGTTSAAADSKSETPDAIPVAEPNRVTPVATPVGDLVATPTPTANCANPVATTPPEKTVPTGATDDSELPQSNVNMNPWTPGVVRYAAMQLVAENWERLAVHVECAGDTPIAKLAQFKRGMSKHGVTEVQSDKPHCLFIFFFL